MPRVGGFKASGTAVGHSQDLSKGWGRGTTHEQEAPPTWGSARRPSPAHVVIQTLPRPRTASGPAPPFPHLGEDPQIRLSVIHIPPGRAVHWPTPRPSQPGPSRTGDRDMETQTSAPGREPDCHHRVPRAPGTARACAHYSPTGGPGAQPGLGTLQGGRRSETL